MSPRPCSARLRSVQVPYEPWVQAERCSEEPTRGSGRGSYCTRAPVFSMPRASVGDESACAGPEYEPPALPRGPQPRQATGGCASGPGVAGGCAAEDCCDGVLLALEMPRLAHAAVSEVGDEMSGVGGIVAQKYYLDVCLGDRIPLETGAARVNSSRLETGPEWRDFLQRGVEGELCDGQTLDELLQCPCCLGVLRRPVGLPCGHTLCRGCLMRLPVSPAATGGARRCPLCRASIPRDLHLHVNEQLDTVSEALHVFRTMRRTPAGHGEGRKSGRPLLRDPLAGLAAALSPRRP